MAHKNFLLTEPDQEVSDFALIAIHSVSEPYLLAFKINRYLNRKLQNVTEFFSDTYDQPFYSRFVETSNYEHNRWELIANQWNNQVEDTPSQNTLFSLHLSQRNLLIKGLNQVDYFLKIPHEEVMHSTINQLYTLNEIHYVYEINDMKIKLNPNLIFE